MKYKTQDDSKEKKQMKKQNQILTIPNLMSFFRLCLIPLIIWLYHGKHMYGLAALALVVSGITDVADGYVARHFNMVSDFGKALDPVADKLTQFSMLVCLAVRFQWIMVPVVLIFLKEVTTGILKMVVIRKTGVVEGAEWHGKLTTVLLYLTIFIHIVWYDIPKTWSVALTVVCTAMMLISFILYGVHNVKMLKSGEK